MTEFDSRVENMGAAIAEAEMFISAAAMMLPNTRPIAERLEEVRAKRFAENLSVATQAQVGDDGDLERTIWMLNRDAQRLPKTAIAVSVFPLDIVSGIPETFILTDTGVSVVMGRDAQCRTKHNDLKFDEAGKLTIPITGQRAQTYTDGVRGTIDFGVLTEPLRERLQYQLSEDITKITSINTGSRDDRRYLGFVQRCQLDNIWDVKFEPLDLTDAEPVVERVNEAIATLGPLRVVVRLPDDVGMFPDIDSTNGIIARPVEETPAFRYLSDGDCTAVAGSLEHLGIKDGVMYAYVRGLVSRNEVVFAHQRGEAPQSTRVLAEVRLSPNTKFAGRELRLPQTDAELHELLRVEEFFVPGSQGQVNAQLPRRYEGASRSEMHAADMTIDTVDVA